MRCRLAACTWPNICNSNPSSENTWGQKITHVELRIQCNLFHQRNCGCFFFAIGKHFAAHCAPLGNETFHTMSETSAASASSSWLSRHCILLAATMRVNDSRTRRAHQINLQHQHTLHSSGKHVQLHGIQRPPVCWAVYITDHRSRGLEEHTVISVWILVAHQRVVACTRSLETEFVLGSRPCAGVKIHKIRKKRVSRSKRTISHHPRNGRSESENPSFRIEMRILWLGCSFLWGGLVFYPATVFVDLDLCSFAEQVVKVPASPIFLLAAMILEVLEVLGPGYAK